MIRSRMSAVTAVGILLLACDGDPADPPPDPGGPSVTLEAVSPLELTGTAGGPLKTPPAVVARDEEGRAVAGLEVRWSVDTGGGEVTDTFTTTDGAGEASTIWMLPPTVGTYATQASAEGVDPVTFDATAGPDTVPPTLTGLMFGADTVEVGYDAVELPVRVTAVDSGSGVYWTVVRLRGPSTSQTASCSVLAEARDTATERVTDCTLAIPAHAEAGPWTVDALVLQDRIRNETQTTGEELANAGLSAGVEVASAAPDTVPPMLLALSFEPDTVTVDSGPATVLFTAELVDSLSGVRAAQLAVDAPQSGFVECLEMDRVEGTAARGTWSCPVTIQQGAQPGTWTLVRFTAWDRADNWKSTFTAELRTAGFPTQLTVLNSDPDTAAPALVGLSLQPDSVQLSGSAVPVEIGLAVTDDRGVAQVEASLRAPGASSASGCAATTPAEGTATDGVFRCSVDIPAAGVAGEWTVDNVSVIDGAGNRIDLSTQQLLDAGLDPVVTVIR